MNPNSNLNRPPEKLDIAQNSEVVERVPGDLDNFALESILAQQDLPPLEDLQPKLPHTPQKALYIVEIDGQFYFLNYAVEGYEPKPVPIKNSDLVVLTQAKPETLRGKTDNTSLPRSTSFLSKRGLPIGIAVGVLFTLAIGRVFAPQTATNSSDGSALVEESAAPARAVTIAEVTTTDIDSTLNVSGTVRAFELTPVMSQAAGLQITDVLVERGDYVEQGQVLARLNNKVLTAEKIQAEGAVNQACPKNPLSCSTFRPS